MPQRRDHVVRAAVCRRAQGGPGDLGVRSPQLVGPADLGCRCAGGLRHGVGHDAFEGAVPQVAGVSRTRNCRSLSVALATSLASSSRRLACEPGRDSAPISSNAQSVSVRVSDAWLAAAVCSSGRQADPGVWQPHQRRVADADLGAG